MEGGGSLSISHRVPVVMTCERLWILMRRYWLLQGRWAEWDGVSSGEAIPGEDVYCASADWP